MGSPPWPSPGSKITEKLTKMNKMQKKVSILKDFGEMAEFPPCLQPGLGPWGGPYDFTEIVQNGWFWYASGAFLVSPAQGQPGSLKTRMPQNRTKTIRLKAFGRFCWVPPMAEALAAAMGGTLRFHQNGSKRMVLVWFWDIFEIPAFRPARRRQRARKQKCPRTIPKPSI